MIMDPLMMLFSRRVVKRCGGRFLSLKKVDNSLFNDVPSVSQCSDPCLFSQLTAKPLQPIEGCANPSGGLSTKSLHDVLLFARDLKIRVELLEADAVSKNAIILKNMVEADENAKATQKLREKLDDYIELALMGDLCMWTRDFLFEYVIPNNGELEDQMCVLLSPTDEEEALRLRNYLPDLAYFISSGSVPKDYRDDDETYRNNYLAFTNWMKTFFGIEVAEVFRTLALQPSTTHVQYPIETHDGVSRACRKSFETLEELLRKAAVQPQSVDKPKFETLRKTLISGLTKGRNQFYKIHARKFVKA